MNFKSIRRCSLQFNCWTMARRFPSFRPWIFGKKRELFLKVERKLQELHDARLRDLKRAQCDKENRDD